MTLHERLRAIWFDETKPHRERQLALFREKAVAHVEALIPRVGESFLVNNWEFTITAAALVETLNEFGEVIPQFFFSVDMDDDSHTVTILNPPIKAQTAGRDENDDLFQVVREHVIRIHNKALDG